MIIDSRKRLCIITAPVQLEEKALGDASRARQA